MDILTFEDDVEIGFSANRLTTARQCRGLTMKALADALGVSQPAVTAYEQGIKKPEPSRIDDIARILDFPRGYFFGPDFDEIPDSAISFRARRALTATVRDKVLGRSKHASSLLSGALRKRFKYPDVDLPALTHETPETAARLLRNHWKLGFGPVSNMVHLLEAKGVEVYWLSEASPCVDALSYHRGQQPFVFLNTHKDAGERGRFDAAHELGHLVLHRNLKVLDNHKVEAEADQFASAFLLPQEQFTLECPRLPVLVHYLPLKARWGTSVQAMIRRSYDLGILSKWHYENSFKELSRRGWRTEESGKLQREQSGIHNKAYKRLSEKGVTPDDFAKAVGLPLKDLCELMPAASEFVEAENTQRRMKHLRLVNTGR